MNWFHELSDTLKHWIDAISLGVVAAAVMKALPEITAVLSFFWVCLRIYETRTVTFLVKKIRERRVVPQADIQNGQG